MRSSLVLKMKVILVFLISLMQSPHHRVMSPLGIHLMNGIHSQATIIIQAFTHNKIQIQSPSLHLDTYLNQFIVKPKQEMFDANTPDSCLAYLKLKIRRLCLAQILPTIKYINKLRRKLFLWAFFPIDFMAFFVVLQNINKRNSSPRGEVINVTFPSHFPCRATKRMITSTSRKVPASPHPVGVF